MMKNKILNLSIKHLGCEWEDGFWPTGEPVERVSLMTINGICHLALEKPIRNMDEEEHLKNVGVKVSSLMRLINCCDDNAPIVFMWRREGRIHLYDICQVYPDLGQGEILFDCDYDSHREFQEADVSIVPTSI